MYIYYDCREVHYTPQTTLAFGGVLGFGFPIKSFLPGAQLLRLRVAIYQLSYFPARKIDVYSAIASFRRVSASGENALVVRTIS